jgi:PadR family transcriptional regulator, regulatory protein AphA
MPQENKSRYAVLGLLSLKAMSGYEIKKMIEQSTHYFWHEHFPQIYPMLKQLEAEGLTTGHVEHREGRPERHIYTLTEQGWEALRQWLALPPVLQVERNELLLKLFFGKQTTDDVSVTHMQQFREELLLQIAILEQQEISLKETFPNSRHLSVWLITINYGLHVKRALITWCDETLAQLQQTPPDSM